jgi:hypothetical protein
MTRARFQTGRQETAESDCRHTRRDGLCQHVPSLTAGVSRSWRESIESTSLSSGHAACLGELRV